MHNQKVKLFLPHTKQLIMANLKQKFDSALTQKERLAILAETVREKQFDTADKMRAEIIMGSIIGVQHLKSFELDDFNFHKTDIE